MSDPLPPAMAASALARTARLHDEPDSPGRSPFRRDRDRIVHAQAFRRLAHKTQVFSYVEGDHYRTRLTHTIEVAQIARSLARNLGLDSDLAEALALAHDLGHTPFGHTGEDALSACMAPYGGFEHNAQTLRIVTRLEQRYARFDGLNLTLETLDGLIKHNGPVLAADGTLREGRHGNTMPFALRAFLSAAGPFGEAIDLASHACLEAQIAALSDDIAYTTHDIDDGVRAGFFRLEDLAHIPLLGRVLASVDGEHPGLPQGRRMGEFTRRLITVLIEGLERQTRAAIARMGFETARDVLDAGQAVATFDDATAQDLWLTKAFLFRALYRHEGIVALRSEADRVVRALFGAFMAAPDAMPEGWAWQAMAARGDEAARARHVCDFIAGMTDRYALTTHARLFDDTPDLRYGAP